MYQKTIKGVTTQKGRFLGYYLVICVRCQKLHSDNTTKSIVSFPILFERFVSSTKAKKINIYHEDG